VASGGAWPVYAAALVALPRVLAERKRLLVALRLAMSEYGGFACPESTESQMRSAIAFAEESAP
jgi:hypothetical protein